MKQRMRNRVCRAGLAGLGLAAFLMLGPGQAMAETSDSTEAIITLLREKNIITEEEAAKILRRHKGAPARQLSSAPPVSVIVPEGEEYLRAVTDNVARDIKEEVKQQVKLEIKDEIAREVKLEAYTGSVPGWVKRIRFGGDIRLRYQGDYFDKGNVDVLSPGDPTEILNRNIDRNRLRYRVRLAVKAKVNNQTEAGVRLATGNTSEPISTNDTLGDYMNKDTVTFDRAYIKWNPIPETSTWTGNLDLWGGRFPNPFFFSDLVWDKDLNFEGVAVKLKVPINARWKGLANAGVFPLEEVNLSSEDKWLYGGQLGFEYAPRTTFNFKMAAAYYAYENIQGKANDPALVVDGVGPYDYTAPKFQQTGNVIFDINSGAKPTKFGLASKYEELNITSALDIGVFDPIHINFLADYVVNLAFDQQEVMALTEEYVPKENTGYQVGVTVGYPKIRRRWDWQTYFFYKYLEADAVLDAFTDSDFHLGGTNAKGWILGGQLGLDKNIWVNTRWLSSDETYGPPIAVDTWQFDLNSRF